MVQKAHIHQVERRLDPFRGGAVGGGRLGAARRVVVGEDDGGGVMMQDAGEERARGNVDRPRRARRHPLEGEKPVLLIQKQHAERFQPLPFELQHQEIAHMIRRRERPRRAAHLFRHETPRQLRDRKNLRRLRLAEAAHRLQIGGAAVEKPDQPAARFQQILGETPHIYALRPGAQQNRQQFIIGQRRRPLRQKALARHIR